MMRERCTRLVLVTAACLFACAPLLDVMGAQTGIPASSFVPADAVECPAEARLTIERLHDLGATTAAGIPEGPTTPIGDVTPAGAPADAATIAAVTKAIRQYIACLNEGNWAVAYGLHASDTIRYLATDSARDTFGIDPTVADYPFLAEWTGPLRHPYGRIDVQRVALRPDGRIEATVEVVVGKRPVQREIMRVALVQEDGEWRMVSPIRRLPESLRLAAPPRNPLPVYLTDYLDCPDDGPLTLGRLHELGETPASGEPEPAVVYDDVDLLPAGDLADEATVDDIDRTLRQYFDCVKAGDWAAAYAMYTDDTLRFLVTDPTREFMDVDPTTANYPFLRSRPFWEGVKIGRIDIYRVTKRPDGRIGAAIGIEERPRRARRGLLFIVLAWEHGRWRLVSPLSTLAFPFGDPPTAIP